jgi:putative ABC transport system permease protein
VRYQLLIMFLIAGATGLGLLMAVLGGAWRLTDHRHRLRPDRLVEATSGRVANTLGGA